MFVSLRREVEILGKPEWRGLLAFACELHERSTLEPVPPFTRRWEQIGPGYVYGPAFGHWDLVHSVLDSLPSEPAHARDQVLNVAELVQDDGYLPSLIWMRDMSAPRPQTVHSCPPVWPVLVEELERRRLPEAEGLTEMVYPYLQRQIEWFERERAAEGGGFYYLDVFGKRWESGVDEGVRFRLPPPDGAHMACVDATSHIYFVYQTAARWATRSRRSAEAEEHAAKAQQLQRLIQSRLFDDETGFFYDAWTVGQPERRRLAFEGIFPLVFGAASEVQAQRVIDENLLSPERFFAPHPIPTVALCDPKHEMRMWRGPTWNSMTMWAARGCLRYGRKDAARALAERALDGCAAQFERTGTIWEFYDPRGGDPLQIQRKPQTKQNAPCRDYLGHNPLIELARLWEESA